MLTSTTKEFMEYGFLINPSTYCKVINLQSKEELLLSPGIQYYIPWDRKDVEIRREEVIITGDVHPASLGSIIEKESLNWLKIAEKSFRFWDNEVDNIWNNV